METLFTVSEAALFLRVDAKTVRRYVRLGHLKASRLPGGDYRFTQDALIACLAPVLTRR